MTAPRAEVLKNMIDNIEGKLDDHAKVHETIIALIKEIQSELRESNGWKNKFMGALGVIMFVVFPIMSWALWEVVHIDEKINEALAESLDEKIRPAVAESMETYLQLNGYAE